MALQQILFSSTESDKFENWKCSADSSWAFAVPQKSSKSGSGGRKDSLVIETEL